MTVEESRRRAMGGAEPNPLMSTILTKAVACESCTYWKSVEAKAAGECRRHAPQTIAFTVDADVKFESRFPVTKAADWCGDYSAKN